MIKRLFLALLMVATVTVVAAPVDAQDLEEDLAEVEAKLDEIAAAADAAQANRSAVAAEVSATTTTMNRLLAELGATRSELGLIRDEVLAQEVVLSSVRSQLRTLYLELASTQVNLAATESDATQWAIELYMQAGAKETSIALASDDLGDLSLSLAYLDVLSTHTDRAILNLETLQQLESRQQTRIEEREVRLEAELADLEVVEAEVAAVEATLAEQQAAVAAELAKQQGLLWSIEGEIEHFESELDSLAAEQDRIRRAIEDATAGDTVGAGGGDGGGGGGGGFIRPVPGPVTSPFGPRLHPILGYTRMHTGQDYRAGSGDPIAAVSNGTVILAGWYGGYGNTVVVDHGGGITTLYAHQSSLGVSVGQSVQRGGTVGWIGSTGLSTGPHLHFEVRVNGSPVNPEPYF